MLILSQGKNFPKTLDEMLGRKKEPTKPQTDEQIYNTFMELVKATAPKK